MCSEIQHLLVGSFLDRLAAGPLADALANSCCPSCGGCLTRAAIEQAKDTNELAQVRLFGIRCLCAFVCACICMFLCMHQLWSVHTQVHLCLSPIDHECKCMCIALCCVKGMCGCIFACMHKQRLCAHHRSHVSAHAAAHRKFMLTWLLVQLMLNGHASLCFQKQ